ncbi:MAG: metallophosphoesterase family protein [Nitrospirae bacterium]|nr:metallophosphoesterase family protein [Nitrospirota bacterium]
MTRTFRIGVIADTHGLFDRAILRHFQSVDQILHAGDIGDASVLAELERLAPVHAVSGNVDGFGRSGLAAEALLRLGARRIALRHILYEGGSLTSDGAAFLDRERPDICVFGHTHKPTAIWRERMLLFNPGSAGPKRFSLPRSLGLLTLTGDEIIPQHLPLADRAE